MAQGYATKKLPIEDFFKEPTISNMRISPDGKFVGCITPYKDIKSAVTINIDTMEVKGVRGSASQDVNRVEWASNEHMVLSVIKDNIYASGIYSLKRGTQKVEVLNRGDVVRIIDTLIDDPKHILVWIVDAIEGGQRLVKYNIESGLVRTVPLKKGLEGKILGLDTNSSGDIIEATVYRDGQEVLLHRINNDSPWKEIKPTAHTDLVKAKALEFDEAKNAYWVVGYKEGDQTASLYHYFLKDKTLSEPIFTVKEYDLYSNCSLRYCKKLEQVVGLRYQGKGPQIVWFDPEYKELQLKLDSTFKDSVNLIIDTDKDRKRIVVYAYSDRVPGNYRIIDLEANAVLLKDSTRSWINPSDMAKQLVLNMKMRDGLKLEGYVTLPGPKEEGPYPMITLAHGGPWARDTWGFDSVTQFLANRGYAVLQLNFRGSTGYSRKITDEYSGDFKGMVDDLSEATRHLVKGGIADPERLAIMGASFGGYAAIASAAFDPDLYQCAISMAGVFDIEKQMDNWKSRFWKQRQGTYAYDSWVETLGDPKSEEAYIKSISPIYHTDKIKVPVFLIHGRSDRIVSHTQSRKLAKELTKNDNKPETFFMSWQSHSIASLKDNVKAYSKIEEFLAEHIGSN
ncbi:prolyl oligopeptidase family serine peptidase [Puniceicoccaceae bacterium K14]|nr:prolyl oligopeptidase family serine peptidase [Puniceicoccaceae bacterium K14]